VRDGPVSKQTGHCMGQVRSSKTPIEGGESGEGAGGAGPGSTALGASVDPEAWAVDGQADGREASDGSLAATDDASPPKAVAWEVRACSRSPKRCRRVWRTCSRLSR
jgi:hypothetical protein